MATFIEFEPKENANILSTILKEKDSLQVEKDVAYLRDWLTKQSHLPQDIGKINDYVKAIIIML